MKRFLAALLGCVMCFSLSVPAFAAETEKPDSFVEKGGVVTLDSNGEAVVEVPAEALNGADITPFAGGTETWSKTGGKVKVGTFTMTGNNLTPVKTVGVSGYNLGIVTNFSSSKKVILTVSIRKAYTSTVLGGGIGKSTATTKGSVSTGLASVKKGDKVQIYFRVTDANGKYDTNLPCTITYYYQYVKPF